MTAANLRAGEGWLGGEIWEYSLANDPAQPFCTWHGGFQEKQLLDLWRGSGSKRQVFHPEKSCIRRPVWFGSVCRCFIATLILFYYFAQESGPNSEALGMGSLGEMLALTAVAKAIIVAE